MVRQGVPIAVVDWTCYMLGNRNITITKWNTTLREIIESECLQGGVLSPLLWSLVVDELLHLLTHQGYHPIGYADDIVFIVRGIHLDALMGVMEQTLKAVDTWCRTTGLSVNPGKTDVVIFTKRYKWSTTGTLELKWQHLEISKHDKYPGVILDNKLTWKDTNNVVKFSRIIHWRSNRRKTEDVLGKLGSDELVFAVWMSLRAAGKVDASNVLKYIFISSPSKPLKYRKALKQTRYIW